MSTTIVRCKDIGIIKSEFATKTQFLLKKKKFPLELEFEILKEVEILWRWIFVLLITFLDCIYRQV